MASERATSLLLFAPLNGQYYSKKVFFVATLFI